MTLQYNSFKEIDEHLKILSLHRDIEKEQLKLYYTKLKINLSPATCLSNKIRSFLKKRMINLFIFKLGRLLKQKKEGFLN